MGKYDQDLLVDYTREEWDTMDGFLDHWRDMTFLCRSEAIRGQIFSSKPRNR